ncbi:MAG: shikimate dehydrogenase [Hyphomonadaceae bacterium]|nr:shikimate dehydrogenase [Hyphomonadaceae bacterium]
MRPSASTRLAGVIGQPVRHSLSPVMHNAWCAAHGIDATYLAFDATPETFETVVRGLAAGGAAGVNVTVPFKEKALALADSATAVAGKCGAANTLVFQNGAILADNTDGAGFVADLQARAPDWQSVPGGVMILGAGGAARGIAAALLAEGVAGVMIVARRSEQAAALCQHVGGGQPVSWASLESHLPAVGVLVNATPRGLRGHDPLMLDLSGLRPDATVYDTVYIPRETALLATARARGLRALDGLGMLVGQGALAFERFFHVHPDLAVGAAAIEQHSSEQSRKETGL